MSAYIAIGGSKHGSVLYVDPGQVLIRAIKSRPLFDFSVSGFDDLAKVVHHEEYTVRRFGLNGTNRHTRYAVLASIDDQTACQMIDAYEALDEESASELARL